MKEIFESYYKQVVLVIAISVLIIALLGYRNTFAQVESNALSDQAVPNEVGVQVEDWVHIDISGAVKMPGLYKLNKGARIADALSMSGGLLESSDASFVNKNLNIAALIVDSSKLYIPYVWDTAIQSPYYADTIYFASDLEAEQGTVATPSGATANLIDLNTADKSSLLDLEGVGEVYANKIIQNRPYKNKDDFIDKTSISLSILNKFISQTTYK